jgi:phage RecT family recombinase
LSTQPSKRAEFSATVTRLANSFLADLVGPEQLQQAAGRLALALRQASAANPRIAECDPGSIAECIAKSALTDLMPGGVKPLVYLIPRKGRLEWQVSARGLAALAERSGWRSIVARPVHTADVYEVQMGTDESIIHHPSGEWPERLDDCKAFYVVGIHATGMRVVVPVPMGVITRRRKASQSDNVWSQWPIEMAQKTAVAWAISRGYFGGLESTSGFEALSVAESQPYREAQPARPAERPAAIEHHVDAEAFEAVLDAAEEVAS